MAFRVLENIEDKMLNAILKIGAAEGVKNVTARKIAEACDISTFTVFERFKTKRGYLDAAAQSFDKKHMEEIVTMYNEGKTLNQVWDEMLARFLADPDGTLYYISYTNEFGFDPTPSNPRAMEFLQYAKLFFGKGEAINDLQCLLMWDYITSMAFYYAEKIIHNFIENTDENKRYIADIVFKGISNL